MEKKHILGSEVPTIALTAPTPTPNKKRKVDTPQKSATPKSKSATPVTKSATPVSKSATPSSKYSTPSSTPKSKSASPKSAKKTPLQVIKASEIHIKKDSPKSAAKMLAAAVSKNSPKQNNSPKRFTFAVTPKSATKNTKFSPNGSSAVKKTPALTPKGVVATPKGVATPKDAMFTPDVSASPALKKSVKITPRIGTVKKSPEKTTPVAKGVKRKSSLSPPKSSSKKNKVNILLTK